MNRNFTEKIQFKGGSEFILDARLELPIDQPKCFAIICHCFTCSKETITTFRISRLLAKHGIAVLRFDFTGLGHSEGNFSDTNFTTMVNDILAAADYLKTNHETPVFVIGHSLGGTAAITASLQLNDIKGIVTIASPSRPDHVLHHFGEALAQLENNIATHFTVANQNYPIKPQFVTDVRSFNTQELFSKVTRPVLIFSALNDAIVSPGNAEDIARWLGGKSRVITLDKANHLLSARDDTALVADQIIQWIELINASN